MKIIKILSILLSIHVLSFILQYIYQKICFPITLSGFLSILFIHENDICMNIRQTSHLLQNIVSNTIIQSFVASISILISYMSNLLDKNKTDDKK